MYFGQYKNGKIKLFTDVLRKAIMDQGVECHQLGKFDPLQWPSDCLAFFQPQEAGYINPRKLIEAQQRLAQLSNCTILDKAIVTKIEKSNQEDQSVNFSFFTFLST